MPAGTMWLELRDWPLTALSSYRHRLLQLQGGRGREREAGTGPREPGGFATGRCEKKQKQDKQEGRGWGLCTYRAAGQLDSCTGTGAGMAAGLAVASPQCQAQGPRVEVLTAAWFEWMRNGGEHER